MKKLFVDFSGSEKLPNDQRIWIYDCQKRTDIPQSPLNYAERFGKRIFDTDEGEYLAIIFALEQPDYVNDDLEIFSDSKPTIDVLKGNGKRVSAKAKPYVDNIQKLCIGRKVSFSYINREENPAGYKAEGHPCDKKARDIEREILRSVKKKDGLSLRVASDES
jgi:ribonuclease HI